MTVIQRFIGIIGLQIYTGFVLAGGPLIIQGNTTVKYQNPNITVHVESGDLGVLTNTQANALLQEALDLWNLEDTSTINLTINATLITNDINAGNFQTVLPSVSGIIQNNDDNLNPVVYDNDGAIIDAFFGVGQSDDTVGFAASFFSLGGNFFSEGYAVINGKNTGLSPTAFKLLITHEIGHFFGLDHSQLNINNQEEPFSFPDICSNPSRENYPVMYPFICRDIETLHLDDIVALSALYPASNINNSFGILQGTLINGSGSGIVGANLFAVNITTGEAVSIVSDYLLQETGFYKLYLPAGNYTLHVNSINSIFNGGSSVGPYASSIFDDSFTTPHPLIERTLQDETTGSDAVIIISTNTTTERTFALNDIFDVVSNTGSSNSSSNKILGAPSFVTLLLLLSLLSIMRRFHRSAH